MHSEIYCRKTVLRSAVLLALSINGAALTLSAGDAQAALTGCASPVTTDSGNFTMLNSSGYTIGPDSGTNDVAMSWDGNAYTSSSDYTGPGGPSNVTMSSTDTFFGVTWSAHDIQVFAPGSYSFDTTLQSGAYPNGSNGETGMLNVTVPAGMVGMHMLFDWNGNNNIDVFVVAAPSTVFGSGIGRSAENTPSNLANYCDGTNTTGAAIKNCLFDGKPWGSAGKPVAANPWMLASIDGNGDSVMGIPMAPLGPFAGFNANFNFNFTTALTFTPGTPCNPTVDTVPDQFTFNDITGVPINTVESADAIFPGASTLVSGLGSGVSAPMQITGGEYSKDGGTTWTNMDGTVQNGNTVKVRQTSAATEDGTTTDATLNIGGVFDTFNVTTIDRKPDQFTFIDQPPAGQPGVATSTLVESNTITVAGMDNSVTTPINITGGEYSKDGGATWNTAAGTVQNGDTIKVRQTSSAIGATTTDTVLTLGSATNGTLVSDTFSVTTAGGVASTGNNFTMIDANGGAFGGTNDVAMTWDQKFNTSESDPVTAATAHMRLSTNTPFFGFNWVAHHIRIFQGPGTFTINVDCTTDQIETGTCAANADPAKNYTFTVGADQIAAHMLFDWGKTSPTPCGKASCNIDVVDVWDKDAVFGPSPMFTGPSGFNAASTSWSLMSGDWDGDGRNGAAMIDGPFVGFAANFNINFTGTISPTNYTPTVDVADPSNAPGCSISPTPVSALKRADWWLVGGFLMWLGGIRLRFKRRQAKS